MAGLNLHNLSLQIKGRRCGPSSGGWWATNGLDWVYSIIRISGLQELHVEFDLGKTQKFYNAKLEQRTKLFRHIS